MLYLQNQLYGDAEVSSENVLTSRWKGNASSHPSELAQGNWEAYKIKHSWVNTTWGEVLGWETRHNSGQEQGLQHIQGSSEMNRKRKFTSYGKRSLPFHSLRFWTPSWIPKFYSEYCSNEKFRHLVLLHISSAAQLYVCFGRCSRSALNICPKCWYHFLWVTCGNKGQWTIW